MAIGTSFDIIPVVVRNGRMKILHSVQDDRFTAHQMSF